MTTTANEATRPVDAGLARGIGRSTRAEILRLRRWPAVWIIIGAWLLLSLMFGYLFNYLTYKTGSSTFASEGTTKAQLLGDMLPTGVPEVFVDGMPMFGGALMMVLGAIVAGNGYGWGSWKTIFAVGVRREAGVLGSMVALTGAVLVTMAASLVLDLGLSTLIAATESQSIAMPAAGALFKALGAGFLVLEMWALLGFFLGTLVRGAALSVGLGLVWSLVVENLLRGVGSLLSWVNTLTEVLPGTAAGSLVGSIVGVSKGGDGTPGVVDTITGGRAAVTVAIYIVLAAAATLALVRRRDVT